MVPGCPRETSDRLITFGVASPRDKPDDRRSSGGNRTLPGTRFLYVSQCVENCLESNYTKPGYCPERISMTPFEAVCLIACVDDSRCPDLAKCCSHDCGVTCMRPVGLDDRNGKRTTRSLSYLSVSSWLLFVHRYRCGRDRIRRIA